MYEYHGWASLWDTPSDDDAYLPDQSTLVAVRAGMSNHAGGMDVLEVFKQIAELAPGSYGLLHVHDDEAGSTFSPAGDSSRMTRTLGSRTSCGAGL